MKRLSSLRTTRAPTPSTPIFCPPLPERFPPFPSKSAALEIGSLEWIDLVESRLFRRLCNLHAPGGIQHRLDDVVIAGAAADVALEFLPHGGLVEAAAMARHDVDRGHDHARRAIAALQAMIVAERGLHRMQFVALGDAFDGGDIGAVGLSHQHGAGFHCAAIDMHDAGAALAGIATDMGAGQAQMIAQEMDKERPVLDVGRYRLAVYRQFDCRHAETSRYFLVVPIRGTERRLCN